MSYDSLIASGNTALQRAGLDRSTLSRSDHASAGGSGDWGGTWFDADADGKRLPIGLPDVTRSQQDVGQLADRVLAAIGS